MLLTCSYLPGSKGSLLALLEADTSNITECFNCITVLQESVDHSYATSINLCGLQWSCKVIVIITQIKQISCVDFFFNFKINLSVGPNMCKLLNYYIVCTFKSNFIALYGGHCHFSQHFKYPSKTELSFKVYLICTQNTPSKT